MADEISHRLLYWGVGNTPVTALPFRDGSGSYAPIV